MASHFQFKKVFWASACSVLVLNPSIIVHAENTILQDFLKLIGATWIEGAVMGNLTSVKPSTASLIAATAGYAYENAADGVFDTLNGLAGSDDPNAPPTVNGASTYSSFVYYDRTSTAPEHIPENLKPIVAIVSQNTMTITCDDVHCIFQGWQKYDSEKNTFSDPQPIENRDAGTSTTMSRYRILNNQGYCEFTSGETALTNYHDGDSFGASFMSVTISHRSELAFDLVNLVPSKTYINSVPSIVYDFKLPEDVPINDIRGFASAVIDGAKSYMGDDWSDEYLEFFEIPDTIPEGPIDPNNPTYSLSYPDLIDIPEFPTMPAVEIGLEQPLQGAKFWFTQFSNFLDAFNIQWVALFILCAVLLFTMIAR